jgi:hypothetical protein
VKGGLSHQFVTNKLDSARGMYRLVWMASADNSNAFRSRLYYDPGRSRLFDACGGVYDFSWLYSTRAAKLWCAVEGVEFFDNRLSRLPENLRPIVTAARRAGSPAPRSIGAFESGMNAEVAARTDQLYVFDERNDEWVPASSRDWED